MFVTDRGRPAHVRLRIEDDHRLAGGARSLGAALAVLGLSDIDLDPPNSELGGRVPDLA